MTSTYDVEIKVIGKKNPIIVTSPFTPEGGAVFGSPHHPMIGTFTFWTRPEDPRPAIQAKADRHCLNVRWA